MNAPEHLAAVRALRDTRAGRRNASLIAPLAGALEFLLGGNAPAVMPLPTIPETPADEDSDTDTLDEEVSLLPIDPVAPAVAPVGSWDVVEVAPPVSRAAAAAAAEKGIRKRLNSKAGRAEIKQRSRRVLGSAPAAVSPRRSVASPETVEALRGEGPKTFQVNLYV